MNAPMTPCAQCEQLLNLEVSHYVVGKTLHGHRHFLHQSRCADRFAESHQITIEVEVHGHEIRLYT